MVVVIGFSHCGSRTGLGFRGCEQGVLLGEGAAGQPPGGLVLSSPDRESLQRGRESMPEEAGHWHAQAGHGGACGRC